MKIISFVLKSKWTYVIALALGGLISGSTYSDRIVQAIQTLIGP